MESRMLGNLLVRFGRGLIVITNFVSEAQLIYPYYNNEEKLTKKTIYPQNSEKKGIIEEYNNNGKLIKQTYYRQDGETIEKIAEFNNEGRYIRTLELNKNGQLIVSPPSRPAPRIPQIFL